MRFEDDSLESAKNVKQWNVKIISVCFLYSLPFSLLKDFSFLVQHCCLCSAINNQIKHTFLTCLQISKNKRHQDRAAALEVWDRLEEFARSRTHS